MKYWVYMNGEVPGCYTPQELGALAGFGQATLVCPAEGELLEKNWRRSGEFTDLAKVIHERDEQKVPSASAADIALGDVDLLLDTTSARLFSHVSTLMKELENRREERALTQSLQRQLAEHKDRLQQARERNAALEERLPRLSELEDVVRKDQERLQSLEASLKAREEGLSEMRMLLERTRGDLENSKRRLGEAVNDLAIRNRLVDKLSRDLSEKELSLTKALGLIRRLEEDLHKLMPALGENEAPVAAAQAAASAASSPAAPSCDPLPAAPLEAPQAQNALADIFKRFVSKDLHS